MNNATLRTLVAALGAASASGAFACASCGCSINSDWSAQGLSAAGGWSLDLRYDFLNQNKLWAGTRSISPGAAASVTNPKTGDPAEVEQYTKNHYLTATVDYSDGNAWGVSVSLPFIDRSHSTLGVGSDGATFDPANGAYTSSGSGLGDVRVVGRYFGLAEMHNLGLQLGLKLPTGEKNQVADDGSLTPVDPGLQRGTGTTDLIAGAYYFDELTPDWGYFTQATFQAALNHSTMAGGSYKPGNNVNASIGLRYKGFTSFVPTVQLNARYAKTDSGEAADTYATGGKLVYLTLGGILPVTENFAPYANVQLPIYQNVNGIQLTPKYTVSVGARYSF
jgi:hypothetical protein